MLQNERYIGNAVLQKSYTTDFLTKTRIKNTGIAHQYYVENDHPSIISREAFLLVQEDLIRRRLVHVSSNGKKRVYSSSHCLAQIVHCGNSGELFRRLRWNNNSCKSIVWRCISRLEKTAIDEPCHTRTVNELLLEKVVVKTINQTIYNKDNFLKQLQKNVAQVVGLSDYDSKESIDA